MGQHAVVAERAATGCEPQAGQECAAIDQRGCEAGAEQFQQDPLGAPLIPNWARVLAAVPDAADLLLEAVESEGGSLAP